MGRIISSAWTGRATLHPERFSERAVGLDLITNYTPCKEVLCSSGSSCSQRRDKKVLLLKQNESSSLFSMLVGYWRLGWPWLTTRTPLQMDLLIFWKKEQWKERESERQAVRQKKQIGKNKIARWAVTETEKYIIGKGKIFIVHFTDKIIERWAYQDMHGKDYIPGELDIEILGTKDDDM